SEIDPHHTVRDTEPRGDATGRLQLRRVALPVTERERMRRVALRAGDGENGGRVEAAGKEDHGFLRLSHGGLYCESVPVMLPTTRQGGPGQPPSTAPPGATVRSSTATADIP